MLNILQNYDFIFCLLKEKLLLNYSVSLIKNEKIEKGTL